jgi:hypothetical protein
MHRKIIGQAILFFLIGLILQTGDVSAEGPLPTPTAASGPIDIQIVGGQPANPGEYPWMAALVDSGTSNPEFGQFCGGSLIDPQWVLTAAHCVFANNGTVAPPSAIDVVVGINNLSDGPTAGSSGQRRHLSQIIVHPNYNSNTNDSDIALLHLASAVTLNGTVQTITPLGSGNAALANAGVDAVVTGWGDTTGNDNYSNELREVTVPIVSNTSCNQVYGGITSNMLCAGYAAGGKDSCQGDSGGPLIVPNGSGGWFLAGAVSFGTGCALPNIPGVYARISPFKSWIDGNVTPVVFVPTDFVYLPAILRGQSCVPAAPGDSDNIANALTICSGQAVSGVVTNGSDWDDVYKIQVEAGRQLTISMNGSGGDADLYLFAPGSTDVNTNSPADTSAQDGNNESIQYTVPGTGYWYIDVYAYSGTTNYNVTVTVN